MEIEITPEPTPEERAAIEAALTELLAEEALASRAAWWRAGIGDATDDDEPEPA